MTMRVTWLCVLTCLAAGSASAQDAAVQAPAQTPAEVAPVDTYAYQPDGRRDPFLNLLSRGAEPQRPSGRDGVAGLTTANLTVAGVVQSRGALVAMVQGPDRKTYTLRQGDALQDGVVKAVMSDGLVILQDVNDPLSLVKQREVRKLLRSVEDPKE
jgi:Tfp pilus assembly protein PilP